MMTAGWHFLTLVLLPISWSKCSTLVIFKEIYCSTSNQTVKRCNPNKNVCDFNSTTRGCVQVNGTFVASFIRNGEAPRSRHSFEGAATKQKNYIPTMKMKNF